MTAYTLRPAETADTEALIALRADAEAWLRSRGIQQWTDDYSDYARGALRHAVADGAAWVLCDDQAHTVVATASLSSQADQDFWGWLPADQQAASLYIGKIIVSTAVRGAGLGDAILNWGSQRAADAGCQWLRLDVRRDNHKLQNYYVTRGFTHVRTWHRPGRRTASGWLGQRPSGLVLPTAADVHSAAGLIADEPIGAVSPAAEICPDQGESAMPTPDGDVEMTSTGRPRGPRT